MSEIPSNMVTWFQIPADDPARAWRFYGEVFGWNPEEAYADRKRFGAINGAIGERESEGDTPRLVIRVDDVEATARSIGKAGGKIISQPSEIPGMGMVYAVFCDTEGNVLNIVGDAR
jgi:uncharacterized protein